MLRALGLVYFQQFLQANVPWEGVLVTSVGNTAKWSWRCPGRRGFFLFLSAFWEGLLYVCAENCP